jgi:hypothetical protein
MPQNDEALLLRLKNSGVDFVIIEGVCAVMHGVSLMTFDLDICCRFDFENLKRLEAAVRDLNPHHRLTPNKLPLELTEELASRLKNLYLQTDLGKLDCLSEVAGIGGFHKALERSQIQTMSYRDLRILNIDALIAAKLAVGRERDIAAVKQLEAIKERMTRGL